MGQIQCREKYQVFKEEFVTYLLIACMSIAGATDWLFVLTPQWSVFLAGKTWQVASSALNHLILTEIQKAYGMKALHLVKAVVTRWLWHGATCKRCLKRYKVILEALDQVLVAKPNPEINRHQSDLLEPSIILELLLLDDILTTLKLCLLLQSDHKYFRAIHDVVEQTLITLKEMSED